MSEFRHGWTRAAGLDLHDRACEDVPGLPVVMLHGLAVSHRYLMPTAHVLAGRHPVVVPDLPGFGLSDKPARAYDVGEHAAVVADWLAGRGLDRVAVVGHSFGAEVAARLALLVPETVAALVLAAPTTDPRGRSRRQLIGRWLLDTQVEAPWQVPILARDIVDAKPWRVLATVGHSVRNVVEDDLVKLPVRPLVLAGALDPVAPARWRAEVAAITGGTMVTIGQAGHNVLTTSPRRSAEAIALHLLSV
ncbi:alpha/beta fold hydrolase [Paractinoplanes maris]|uniref:alpha/beta fold hydrolase n=1 Tax=Paractinoplanes maris TaxID=1734446 RepID=UPI002020CA96|nr:alpha/beta hydrolase [Actinoplanes maris]